jgi:hypothetical protein
MVYQQQEFDCGKIFKRQKTAETQGKAETGPFG